MICTSRREWPNSLASYKAPQIHLRDNMDRKRTEKSEVIDANQIKL